ncbi:SCP1.201-like deaminase [Prauserella halophila]|uniref:SCP1.201-like deaminase n=1 Tax=Prauserella halophila TaxID=185641 RepID=A0ABP4GP83_9PSEU|nr:DddA-like double-stranded DNA deaminase toxin [Prauserella halophila]MCP2236303.1 SCP1.201-like deaminase [Prauserella halophila]
MSVEQLAETIGRVLDQLAAARAALAHASQTTVEVRDMYAHCLDGAHDPDAAQTPGVAAEAAEQVDQQHGRLAQIEQMLRGYLDQLGATVAPLAARGSDHPPATPAPAPAEPAPVPDDVAPDGSRYPAAAGWCADLLPPRVRAGQGLDRTVGYVDGVLTPLTSGKDGTWTPAVQRRLATLGLPAPTVQRLGHHVEMKAAEQLVMSGRQHSEVVINNEPCRARNRVMLGCREVLPRYLPAEHTVTVHGTTETGQPFTQTYEGTA